MKEALHLLLFFVCCAFEIFLIIQQHLCKMFACFVSWIKSLYLLYFHTFGICCTINILAKDYSTIVSTRMCFCTPNTFKTLTVLVHDIFEGIISTVCINSHLLHGFTQLHLEQHLWVKFSCGVAETMQWGFMFRLVEKLTVQCLNRYGWSYLSPSSNPSSNNG